MTMNKIIYLRALTEYPSSEIPATIVQPGAVSIAAARAAAQLSQVPESVVTCQEAVQVMAIRGRYLDGGIQDSCAHGQIDFDCHKSPSSQVPSLIH